MECVLKHRDDLESFLVDLASCYDHLHAVHRSGKVDPEQFAQNLQERFGRPPRSYPDLIQAMNAQTRERKETRPSLFCPPEAKREKPALGRVL